MDKPMRVYLAGPMSGIQDHNFPAFRERAEALRSLGLEVVNPAELDAECGTDKEWSWYMRRDLEILVRCDAIALLPGWRKSRGAYLEARVARELGMLVFDAHAPETPILLVL